MKFPKHFGRDQVVGARKSQTDFENRTLYQIAVQLLQKVWKFSGVPASCDSGFN